MRFTSIFSLLLLAARIVTAQQIYINEFLASNVTTNPDIVEFDDYSDWLELYNAENFAIDLTGYFLTDNLDNPIKWQMPPGTVIGAHGYLCFWADGMADTRGGKQSSGQKTGNTLDLPWPHTNFKISKAGEELGLFDRDGNRVDAIVFGLQMQDVSYGRYPNGAADWYFFGEPTPDGPNNTQATWNTDKAPRPTFSEPEGFYYGSLMLELSTDSPTADIRYTTDGSRPTSFSPKFTAPIHLRWTHVIRARVFDEDILPGPITTQAYFINTTHTLPVVSIAAYPETLWDERIGIYANMIKGMEIPVSVSFFEPDQEIGFALDAGMRITGQASFQYPQKPLTVYARDRYGTDVIHHQIFPDRPIDEFSSIYLRNSGTNDHRHTLFRDALQHSIVINQMDLDVQAYRPAVTYINGTYWGIYNIREKQNVDYLVAHHNVDPNNVDFLEYEFNSVPVIVEGDREAYYALLNFINNNDLSVDENYDYVASQIDVGEYLNYLITEIFCDNINWLNTNVKFWREKKEGSKWRWLLLDMDWGFGNDFPGFSSHYSHDALSNATSAPGTMLEGQEWATVLFRKLLENPEFKNDFIQRFASHLNTTFQVDRVVHIVDSLQNHISTEMVFHIDRWNDHPDILFFNEPPISDIGAWNRDVAIMRDFARRRPAYQRQHINDFFGLRGSADLTLSVTETGMGHISVNTVTMSEQFTGAYFKDIPIQIKAVPNVGFNFVEWQGLSNSTSDSISVFLTGDASLTAVFETADVTILASEITSDQTLTPDESPYYAQGDITVLPGVTLTVEAGVEIQMPASASLYVHGRLDMQGHRNEPIVIKPNTRTGASEWGAICLEETTGPSTLTHVRLEKATRGEDLDKHIGAISSFRADMELDYITILDAPFPVFAQYGDIVITNCTLHSEFSSDLINVKYASSALVENCDLRGNEAYDTDAIDYDQLAGGIIRGNRIYNFYGINSDGIDLGENSKDILIENNEIFNVTDKGVSVGQASTTEIRNNVFVNCGQGVGIKDFDAYAHIENNTFYGNTYAIASFEKNVGDGGGNADVVNSIIARPRVAPYFVDALSRLTFSYCLSDTQRLPGTDNLTADPLLANNLRLRRESPAIDAGSPGSIPDPDGSPADIGAFFFDDTDNVSIFINEIHYHPVNGEEFEFVELYNASDVSVDISGYRFTQGIDYAFPEGFHFEAGTYIVVARNAGVFDPGIAPVYQWNEGTLSDKGANVQLENKQGAVIDFVTYSNQHGWASGADGFGPSLELRSLVLENLYTANWRASSEFGGTPGRENKTHAITGLHINELLAINESVVADNKGEYDDWIELYNSGDQAIDVGGLYLTDDFDRPTLFRIPTIYPDSTTIEPHEHLLIWVDDQVEQGIRHAGFQLSNNGEQIGLVQVTETDTLFIDRVTYGRQTTDLSFGRELDGGETWKVYNVPTPEAPNALVGLFDQGILLVNGVSYSLGEEVHNAYRNRSFWGRYSVSFWDLFNEPANGYSSQLPEPLGHGYIPSYVLKKYSTVIWVGNNDGGDLDYWQRADILSYLQAGGNLILLTRQGHDFLDDNLMQYLGIRWAEGEEVTLRNCQAVYPGLNSISLVGYQTANAVFETTLTNDESTILFTETASFETPRGIGVWHKPAYGGAYRSEGGQFVYLSGRPYRYRNQHLRINIEYILDNFFNEIVTHVGEEDEPATHVTEYRLEQNYPNPFNPTTTITYDLYRDTKVVLKVYNILGQEIRTLVDAYQSFGRKRVEWDGTNNTGLMVGSGAYVYRIETEDWNDNKTMILLK